MACVTQCSEGELSGITCGNFERFQRVDALERSKIINIDDLPKPGSQPNLTRCDTSLTRFPGDGFYGDDKVGLDYF